MLVGDYMEHVIDKEKGIDLILMDDSQMPTPEQVSKYQYTKKQKEQSREFEKELARKYGLL